MPLARSVLWPTSWLCFACAFAGLGVVLVMHTHQLLGEAQWVSLWLPRVRLQRCRVCAYAALVLCAVCMHWGRPPAELRAGVRWAKLAWRFGCVGAVRRKRPVGAPLLAAAGRRLGAGGEGEGEKEV
jgi:hypothetical protein